MIDSAKKLISDKCRLTALAVLCIPQLVCLVVFWPGELQWDHIVTVAGVADGAPDQWHSIIWGYVATPIIMALGYGWYGLLQTIIQLALEWWSLESLRKSGLYGQKGELVLAIVYGLSPCFLMYGLLWGTDTLFAVMMMVTVTMMVITVRSDGAFLEQRSNRIALLFLMVMLTQFRKNAVLIPIILYPILMVRYSKVRKTILADLGVVLMVDLILAGVFALAGVTASPPQEMLSVPAQQVGRVARDGGEVSDWAKAEFEKTRPWSQWAKEYQPPDADNMKKNLNGDVPGFLKAWADTGLRNPGTYVQAYMKIEYPYWQLTTDIIHDLELDHIRQDFNDYTLWEVNGKVVPQKAICDVNGGKCYHDPELIEKLLVKHNPRQEWLNNFYDTVMKSHIPIVTDSFTLVFFNAALPLWSIVLSLILIGKGHRKNWLVVWAAPSLIMLTLLMFSPIALFRYALQIIWSLPVLIMWTWKEAMDHEDGRTHSLS